MSTASSCPAPLLCTSESPMENFDENNLNKLQLLDAPTTGDACADDEDEKATLKPRFSPLPRRRSSVSSDDGEIEPPTSVARKVSFADAFGFDLVSVKEFDTWEVPVVSQNFEMESINVEEFFFLPSFVLLPVDIMMEKLHAKKVLLESVDYIPGTTCMKGIVRVLNVSFEKQIYVRMSLDGWQSYNDVLGEYIPDSCTGDTDQFFFNISLVPPYQKEGVKVEFCICYETAIGKFWDSNDGLNYILTCHKRELVSETDKVSDDLADRLKKSCLKPASSKEDEIGDLDEYERKKFRDTEIYIPRIICSHDDDTEENDDDEADNSGEQNNGEENDMDLFPSQCYLKTRITSSEDENNTDVSAQPSYPYGEDTKEPMTFLNDNSSGTATQHQIEQITSDQLTEESELLDITELSPTIKDAFHLQEAGEPSSTSVADYYNLEVLPQEYEVKNNEMITGALSEQNFEQSQKYTCLEPENAAREVVRQEDKISNHDIYDETSEGTSTAQMESLQSVRLLDDNANPSHSHNTIKDSHISVNNNDIIDYEEGEISEHRKAENEHSITSISQTDDGSRLIIKDEEMTLQSQELEHVHGFVNNTAVFENIADSDRGSILPCDTLMTTEAQISNITEETSSQGADSEITCDTKSSMPELVETCNVDWNEKTGVTDFETKTVAAAQQYYDSPSDNTPKYSDLQNVRTYLSYYDNNNSEVQRNFEHSLCEHDKDFTSHEIDNTSVHDKDKSKVKGDVLTERLASNPSVRTSGYESHPSNIVSESLSNTEALEEKVIIALITEEKSHSEIQSLSEDFSKECCTYVCQSGEEWSTKPWHSGAGTELQMADDKLAESISSGSVANRELNEEGTKVMELHIDEKTEGDIREMDQKTGLDELGPLLEVNIMHDDANDVSRDQSPCHTENVPESLTAQEEMDVRYTDLDVQISSGRPDTSIIMAPISNDVSDREESNEKAIDTVEFSEMPQEENCTVNPDQTTHFDYNKVEMTVGPSILISEPDDEVKTQSFEEQFSLEDITQYYSDSHYETVPNPSNVSDKICSDPSSISHVSSKVLCFIMFVVFAGLMYHYDFLFCFALYLFSLYWLYWEGDRSKEPVRKE